MHCRASNAGFIQIFGKSEREQAERARPHAALLLAGEIFADQRTMKFFGSLVDARECCTGTMRNCFEAGRFGDNVTGLNACHEGKRKPRKVNER